MGEKIACA